MYQVLIKSFVRKEQSSFGFNFMLLMIQIKQTLVRGYKTFFMLNSTEHEIYHAHKC